MKRNSLLILSVLVVVIMTSCGNKGGKSGLLVPKDAVAVLHINSASLSSKLSWDEIRQTSWFHHVAEEAKSTDTMAMRLLENPANSGVDTKSDLVFYLKKLGRSGYFIFEGSLSDAGAFEKLCKEINKGKDVKKDGDFSYMTSGDGSVVWNKSHFAYAANAPLPDMSNYLSNSDRSYHRNGFTGDSLKLLGIEALSLKSDDNLDTDNRFASLVKDGSDVHVWMSMKQFYSGMGGGMMSMMKVGSLMKDNVYAISFNFDNGKIAIKSKNYYGEEMSKILAKYKPKPVSADVINRIPSQNIVGVMAFNYSPEGIKEFLKLSGMDAMADMFLAKTDFTLDDFIKAGGGEILLAFSDLNFTTHPGTIETGKGGMEMGTSPKKDMKVLFASSVNDKAAFEKLITMAWDFSKKMGRSGDSSGITYKVENNWFAASNSAEYKDKFLAGGNNKLPFVDKIAGHPMGVYIDLQKILQAAATMAAGDTSGGKAAVIDASLKMWQDVVATGGDFKDRSSEFEMNINLVDKNTNSLKQLNQYIDKVGSLHEEMKRSAMKKRVLRDEEVPNPPPEVK
jgi:hypothetical protein